VATGRIPGSNVKASFLEKAAARVHPVPSGHALFSDSNVARDLGVKLSREVPYSIVPGIAGRPNLALDSVFATTVKRLPAKSAILHPPVLTSGARGAHRQTQAIAQANQEVLVRHEFRSQVLEGSRRLQKPTSTRAAS